MTEWLVLIATCSLETALCQYYYDSFMFFRWDKSQRIISFILVTIMGAGNAVLFEILPDKYYPIKLLTYIVIHMIFVKTCYLSGWIMSIFFSSSCILLQILVQTEIYVLFRFKHGDNQIFINIMCWVSCLIVFFIVVFLRKKLPLIKEIYKKESDELSRFIWLPLSMVVVGLFSYAYFVSDSDMGLFEISISAVLIAVNIVSMFLLQEALVKDEKLRLSEIQVERKQNQLQAFHNMQSLYELQGRKLHDYKKQLATLQELMKSGDVDTAIELTEQITKNIAVEAAEINVGHPVINAVLNQQYRVAKGKAIGMTFAISDLKDVTLRDDDIVVLLGNLLENAIHACEKVIKQGRTASISVKFVEKDGRIILNVRNPISEKVEIVDNKVVNASEEGHGIGLSNVESVAEKNDGTFALSCDDKECIAVVMI